MLQIQPDTPDKRDSDTALILDRELFVLRNPQQSPSMTLRQSIVIQQRARLSRGDISKTSCSQAVLNIFRIWNLSVCEAPL